MEIKKGQETDEIHPERENPDKEEQGIAFVLRMLHNQIKLVMHKSMLKSEKGPKSQLQGGILGYLYHHSDQPVYQRDIEKEFRISRATATNTLQVMEREGLIVRVALDRDARLKRIQVTEAAYRNHRQMEERMRRAEERMLEGLSDGEVDQLRRLLGVMQRNLEEMISEYEGASGECAAQVCTGKRAAEEEGSCGQVSGECGVKSRGQTEPEGEARAPCGQEGLCGTL